MPQVQHVHQGLHAHVRRRHDHGQRGTGLADALQLTLFEGCRTADLGGTSTCSEFGARVRENLETGLNRSGAYRELIAMNRECCG